MLRAEVDAMREAKADITHDFHKLRLQYQELVQNEAWQVAEATAARRESYDQQARAVTLQWELESARRALILQVQ